VHGETKGNEDYVRQNYILGVVFSQTAIGRAKKAEKGEHEKIAIECAGGKERSLSQRKSTILKPRRSKWNQFQRSKWGSISKRKTLNIAKERANQLIEKGRRRRQKLESAKVNPANQSNQ